MEQIRLIFDYLEDEIRLNKNKVTGFSDTYVKYLVEKTKKANISDNAAVRFLELADIAVGELRFYLLSAALSLKKSPEVLKDMLKCVWDSRYFLGVDSTSFALKQCCKIAFADSSLNSRELLVTEKKIYDWVTEQYAEICQDILEPIPVYERDQNLIVVLTAQQIGFKHAPSKTSADRCRILIERMGKRVLLINTAEILSSVGMIPMIGMSKGSYRTDMTDLDTIVWKGTEIPYYQCDQNMPNPQGVKEILYTIRSLKPGYIVSIGGGEITAALADMIIPSLCIGLCFSALSLTGCRYQTYSGQKDERYISEMEAFQLNEDQIIDSVFGFSICDRVEQHSRGEIRVPQEDFVIAIVGARLQTELTDEFWETMQKLPDNVSFVLMGNYCIPNEIDKGLTGRIHPLGMVDDVLSWLDICNLYVNPVRMGGGSSVVEAMSVGLPVITTNFGDVAVNAGEAFWVNGYDEFPGTVIKYMNDRDFYNSQSNKAHERADLLLNAEEEFVRIMKEYQRRCDA